MRILGNALISPTETSRATATVRRPVPENKNLIFVIVSLLLVRFLDFNNDSARKEPRANKCSKEKQIANIEYALCDRIIMR